MMARHQLDPCSLVDAREQLFNERRKGAIQNVSLPKDVITSVHTVMFDLDPKMFLSSTFFPNIPASPEEFCQVVAQPLVARHPLARNAELRKSGTGLHGLLLIDPAIEMKSDSERDRWDGIIKVIQASLPIDPDQPSINALTRPVGSINGKNNEQVEVLCDGKPVTQQQVLEFYEEMARSWFRMIFRVLAGTDRLSPCPICRAEGSTLEALDQIGRCYSSCGTVSLDRLYDLVLTPRPSSKGAKR